MGSVWARIRAFRHDQAGQTTVEWTLLLGAFGIPVIYAFNLLLKVLAEHYKAITFLETLPFP